MPINFKEILEAAAMLDSTSNEELILIANSAINEIRHGGDDFPIESRISSLAATLASAAKLYERAITFRELLNASTEVECWLVSGEYIPYKATVFVTKTNDESEQESIPAVLKEGFLSSGEPIVIYNKRAPVQDISLSSRLGFTSEFDALAWRVRKMKYEIAQNPTSQKIKKLELDADNRYRIFLQKQELQETLEAEVAALVALAAGVGPEGVEVRTTKKQKSNKYIEAYSYRTLSTNTQAANYTISWDEPVRTNRTQMPQIQDETPDF